MKVAIGVIIGMLAGDVSAAEVAPSKPVSRFCSQVIAAAKWFDPATAESVARASGISEAKIREAKKCFPATR